MSTARQVGCQVGATTANVAVSPQNPPITTQNGQVAPPRVKGGPNDLRADDKFVHEVTADNLLEIQLGQVAERKATNGDVKDFANRLVADYPRLQNQWTSISSSNGMAFQPSMGTLHRQKLERVQKASGAKFDRVYMSTVIEHLESIVPYFQNEGRGAHSSQVRKLVENELPTLQQHLAQAKRIGGRVDAATTGSDRPRNVSTRKR